MNNRSFTVFKASYDFLLKALDITLATFALVYASQHYIYLKRARVCTIEAVRPYRSSVKHLQHRHSFTCLSHVFESETAC